MAKGKMTKPEFGPKLAKIAAERGAQVSAYFAKQVLEMAPVENGHIHEAVLTALAQSRIVEDHPAAGAVEQKFAGQRSGDPEARKRANGARRRGDKRYHVRMSIFLPFAAKLEKGGKIRVGDLSNNKGRKEEGIRFPGPLYGPRKSGRGGVLMWKENGQIMRAKVRSVPAHNFWATAAYMARTLATELGLKER